MFNHFPSCYCEVLTCSVFHIDPEPQHRETVQRSSGATRQEGQGAGVFVHRGGVPAVPEGILWQDGRGEEIKCTDTQQTLQPQRKHQGCVLWIHLDFWMLVQLQSAQQSEKLQRRNICTSSICADVMSTDTY